MSVLCNSNLLYEIRKIDLYFSKKGPEKPEGNGFNEA